MNNGRLLILIMFALTLIGGGIFAGHYLGGKGGVEAAAGLNVFGGMVITYIINALRGAGSGGAGPSGSGGGGAGRTSSGGGASGSPGATERRKLDKSPTALRAHLATVNAPRDHGFYDHRVGRPYVLGLVFALLVAWPSFVMTACSSSATLTGIDVARRTVNVAKAGVPNFCTAAVDGCIARRENPCPKLVECRKARRQFVKVLITTNQALQTAARLVKAGKPKAEIAAAVALFTGLAADAIAIAKLWGLKVPAPTLEVR